jgi:hypothetical protein
MPFYAVSRDIRRADPLGFIVREGFALMSSRCIALIPALQVYLLDSASPKPLIQRIGRNRLELCMIVIEELRHTYFGAEIMSRMFPKAEKAILTREVAARNVSRTDDGSSSGNRPPGSVTREDASSNAAMAEDVFDLTFQTLNPFLSMTGDVFRGEEYVSGPALRCVE